MLDSQPCNNRNNDICFFLNYEFYKIELIT